VDVCTIIAKNYLAHARVLARSLAEHHPEARMHVLVIDDHDGYIEPAAEPFTVVTPAQLEIAGFERMVVLYDILELSTAVKPWLMRWLLARSPDGMAIYLDPDMRIYAPLHELFEAVRCHRLVLSPHCLDPMPRDGRRPNEQDILIAGTYNLGFIGIGSGEFADELLTWWSERLEIDCVIDPARGFFVDQRWIDFVPGMAQSVHLLRDRGFNVAYWNLSARPIHRSEDGTWRAADVALRLFHFSGFDRARPHDLSKHQNRISLAEHPDLATLCGDYARELLAAGAEEAGRWPYTYAATASGMPVDAAIRSVHRKLAAAGRPVAPIFQADQEPALLELLNAPAAAADGGDFGITVYHAALHERREDLRREFPKLARGDAAAYLRWLRGAGRGQVPAQLRGPAAVTALAASQPLGVNVAGYLNSELGVGEVARQAIRALDAAAVAVMPIGLPAPHSRQGHAFAHRGISSAGYPVNLICVNADVLPAFAAQAGQRFFAGRHSIGWWWWEVSRFPERWAGSFEHVDELWAGSRFVADAIAAVAPVPVLHVPTPVFVQGTPRAQPQHFGLPAAFTFLFCFDYQSVLARKNPLGCIEAFLRAFPEPGDAVLVLKSINAEHSPDDHGRVRGAAEGHPHVVLLDRYLDPADKDRLLASCDCYVSLHRSEGFGLTLAEAMFLGKPVVATAYSGNLDYMTPENSYLVDCALTPVGPGAEPYPADAEWADPDLDHAAALMREVYEDRDGARRRAQRGQADIRRTHSLEAAGATMAQRLTEISALGATAPGRGARGRGRGRAVELAARAYVALRTGPDEAGGVTRRRRGARVARRVAVRLLDVEAAGAARALDERMLAMLTAAMSELRGLEQRLRAAVEGGLATQARADDLARQVDELRAQLEHQAQLMSLPPASREPEPEPETYPAAPAEPWSHEYNAAHAAFVARALDDRSLIEAVRSGDALPDGYGAGFDERVVEFAWVAGRQLGGSVLDAGSTLNHLHLLRRLRPLMDELHIVTLAPEDRAFPSLGVSYVFADLRCLPFRDETYDRVLSISTLEHVGLDLEHFGADGQRAEDPQRAALAAAGELRRVVRAGGEVLLTVPVGVPERFDWVRMLSVAELDALIARFDPVDVEIAYFRHDDGWRRCDRDGVAGARYRDHLGGAPVVNRVVAAEAVACVALTTR